jgi:outer membrane protein OmpA-like peptidoglycan-associated protein
MTTNQSNTWRWVGVFILLVILLLLWLNGHGPSSAGTGAGCCGAVQEAAVSPALPDVALQQVPPPEPIPESAEASPAVPACSDDMNVAVVFTSGSASLDPVGMLQLDEVAKCLSEKTQVVGYTDSSGSAKGNRQLSKRRAQAVVDYMVSKNAAMSDLLTAVGRGSENPIADNSTEEGRAKNRRIEFLKQ